MKTLSVFRVLVFLTFLGIVEVAYSQVMHCDWDPYAGDPEPPLVENLLGCTPRVSFEDYALMAPFTVYVNIFFDENYEVTEGIQLANDLIGWMNNYLNNVPVCQIPGPNGIPEHVPVAKFDIQLYTEVDNANDLYGGIWFHQLQTGTNAYFGRVVNIRLHGGGCFNGNSGTGIDVNVNGYTPGGDCTATISSLAGSARTILHELRTSS